MCGVCGCLDPSSSYLRALQCDTPRWVRENHDPMQLELRRAQPKSLGAGADVAPTTPTPFGHPLMKGDPRGQS